MKIHKDALRRDPEAVLGTEINYQENNQAAKNHFEAAERLKLSAGKLRASKATMVSEIQRAAEPVDAAALRLQQLEESIENLERRARQPSPNVVRAQEELAREEAMLPATARLVELCEQVESEGRLSAGIAGEIWQSVSLTLLPRINAVRECNNRLARYKSSESSSHALARDKVLAHMTELPIAREQLTKAEAELKRVQGVFKDEIAGIDARLVEIDAEILSHEAARREALERRGPRQASVRIRA